MPPQANCLTIAAPAGKLLHELRDQCGVSDAYDPKTTPSPPQAYGFTAIWDTGASCSVITQKVVDTCGLHSIGPAITHGVGGQHATEAFLVNIMLRNNVGFSGLRVIRGQLPGFDVLIGMDIITLGDFTITNFNKTTVFSFRVPSMGAVDYVKDQQALLARAAIAKRGNRPALPRQHRKGKR